MTKTRLFSLGVLLTMIVAFAGVPGTRPALAAGESWTIDGRLTSGCEDGETGFQVTFNNLTPGATYYADTIVTGPGGVIYMDEYFSATAPGPFDNDWYVFDENDRGMQTGTWPLMPGVMYTITIRLRDASQNQLSVDSVDFQCDATDFLHAPGCDVLITIPASAVGGTFVTDAPLYSEPGVPVSPALSIPAGNSARVIGTDASGQYYKIIWVCDYLWVPAETLGPNYDNVWNGRPLPTGNVN